MEVSNPYEAPRTTAAADDGPVTDPLLAELLRFRPWVSVAGVSVAALGVAVATSVALGSGSRAPLMLLLPYALVIFGCGILSARLLILSRTIRAASTPVHRVDLCIRDVRKVFSHSGIAILAFLVVSVASVVVMTRGGD